jgi:hypothetical protein
MAIHARDDEIRADVGGIRQHCLAIRDLTSRRARGFEATVNANPYAVADRLWVKDQLNPGQESPRFSNEIWFKMAYSATNHAG